ESKRDYQEKDSGDGDDAAREREVVSEITEPSSRPDDQDGDKSDLRSETLDLNVGDGSAIEDEVRASRDSDTTDGVQSKESAVIDKHYSSDDESLAGMVSTEDAPGIESGVEESRAEGKDYTVEGEPLAEVASSDMGTEDKVVSAGGEALEGELGAEVKAVREALEPAASVELETAESRIEQERASGDGDVKDLPREEGTISEVTDPDAKRDDHRDSVSGAAEPESKRDYQEKDSGDGDDAAREREVVSEITEPSSRPDDQDGDKRDLRSEALDPDIRDGSAIEDIKDEVESSSDSDSTYAVPSEDAAVIDKHYSGDDESPAGMVSTYDVPGIDSGVEGKDYTGEGEPLAEAASSDVATEDEVVSAGDKALEGELGAEVKAVREALEPAASVELETGESRVERERDSSDADLKDLSREEGKVSEVTDPDAKRDYQRDSASEDTKPESRRDYQEKDGDTAKELPREVVSEATEYGTRPDNLDGDKSDLRLETLDPDIMDGSAIEDEVRASMDSDTTDGVQSKESAVIDKHYSSDDESPVGMVSTEDVPGIDSGVEGKDYTGEGETSAEAASTDVATEDKVVPACDEALEGELGAEGTAAREALKPTASVELETAESRIEQEKDSGDGDVNDLSREEGTVSEVTEPEAKRENQRDSLSEAPEPESRRDDQEKDGDTAKELPREVVSETTEPSSLPDDPEGDKSDSRLERLDPDIGDGGAIEDEVEVRSSRGSESTYSVPSDDTVGADKHYSADDESPAGMVSTDDVPGIDSGVEETRVEGKDYTGEGEAQAEAASSDVATEDKVLSVGDEALEGELGAEVTAAREALEATASASEDAALETVDIPVYQEKGSGDGDVKDLPREEGIISEVTEPDAKREDQRDSVSGADEPESKRDYQEKDGDTEKGLPREVVPEITEPSSLPDDPDGDKNDLSSEKPGSDLGDHGVEGDLKHEVGDESPSRGVSTEDVPGIDSGVEGKDYTGEGEPLAEVASSDVAIEDKVVPAGNEALEGELGAEVTAIREALEPAASVELETAESRIEQEKGSGDADVKDLPREEGTISEVTDPDAKREDQRDSVSEAIEPESRREDQEKDGDTEKGLPREVVSETTEPSSLPDDPEGDQRDLTPETLDPDVRDGASAFTSAGEEALEAAAFVPEDEALKTVDIPIDRDRDNRNRDEVEAGKKKQEIEEIGLVDPNIDLKAELESDKSKAEPVISGIQQDPVADSGIIEESRVEGKYYTGEGETPAEAASSDVATEDKVVSAGGEALEGAASVELETAESRVEQEKDSSDADLKDLSREEGAVSEATDPDAKRDYQRDSVFGATEPESRRDYQEKDGDTAREREVVSEITEPGSLPNDPEGDKSDSRLERLDPDIGDGGAIEDDVEVRSSRGSESTYSVPSDDTVGVEKHDSGDDESPAGMVSTDDVPGIDSGVEASRVEGKDYTGEGETSAEVPSSDVAPEVVSAGDEALEGELGAEVKAAREALEPAASASEDAALETVDIPVDQAKDSSDADLKDLSREEGTISEVTDPDAKRGDQRDSVSEATEPESRRDYQEKDGDTAKELPREVVSEAIEYGTRPDNMDGDQRDLSPAKSGSDLGDHGVEGDAKHEVGDESSSRGVSTYDVPGIDSGVEGKDYTGEGGAPAEAASSDVGTEEKVVPAGDEALEGELGAEVKAIREALEATASASEDAALETVDIPVYQEKGSGDADVKDIPREEGTVSEVTDPDAKRDDQRDLVSEATGPERKGGYQERDGDTAKELPREVVPEATEYGTRPDDPDGDKSDSRSETLDPDVRDGASTFTSAGEGALEAAATVPEDEALKTVDIPIDQEGDNRNRDEVEAGKKKRETEEIGLVDPNI
ncbi:putative sodium/potassium/calcium exchanger, partial [Anaplasma phagocytophilum]|uniref:hypothetical protein n=1 Tax=Anaplasma phagocytophilum TaxID=948 RepID=UPI0009BF0438